MPFCTYCGQSFNRDEHLERHILTHTNVKPFKCFSCHMSFARRDLLQRHYAVHGKDENQNPLPPSDGIIPKPAGRTPIACTNCAKTKTKCDKKTPCSRCFARNLVCVARPVRRTIKSSNSDDTAPVSEIPADIQSSLSESGPSSAASSRSSSSGFASLTQQGIRNKSDLEDRLEEYASPTSLALDLPPVGLSGTALLDKAPVKSPGTEFRMFPFLPGTETQDDAAHTLDFDWTQIQDASFDWKTSITSEGISSLNQSPNLDIIQPLLGHDSLETYPNIAGSEFLESQGSSVWPPLGFNNLFPTIDPELIGGPISRAKSGLGFEAGEPSSKVGSVLEDAWSCFRCNPCVPSKLCPNNLRRNLENFENSLKQHDQWSNLSFDQDEDMQVSRGHLDICTIQDWGRDKLLAITQAFLHKALDIHRDDLVVLNSQQSYSPSLRPESSGFVLLPPARVLHGFLQIYAKNFERYFALTPGGMLDVNELMRRENNRTSSLLLLAMINYGAMVSGTPEARSINGGLLESCRISLFDVVDKNFMLAGDSTVLHAALLVITQGIWSGDKWHMDIAIGQRGMYTEKLRQSGVLDGSPPYQELSNSAIDLHGQWKAWIVQESRSRIAYSWAMIDLDLSLFHDTTPLMTVAEFIVHMPETDSLWQASSATEWAALYEKTYRHLESETIRSTARSRSLRDLFRDFLDDTDDLESLNLSSLQLRLLLHPLQALVSQLRQFFDCFADGTDESLGASSGTARTNEVLSLLAKWLRLAKNFVETGESCSLMHTNFIVFHLISMNTVADVPAIERLARQDSPNLQSATEEEICRGHSRCVSQISEATFQCAQVVHHIRLLPIALRPPWWAAAVYRVSLVLWSISHVNSKGKRGPVFDKSNSSSSNFAQHYSSEIGFATNEVIEPWNLDIKYATTAVSEVSGSSLDLFDPDAALRYGMELLEEGTSTEFSDAIKSKLKRLKERHLT